MKKIMFSDKYGLTDAVLQGRKTMTRRLADVRWASGDIHDTPVPKYKVGEVVAVAQSYSCFRPLISHNDDYSPSHPGWDNKMFVRADLMPHQIRITDVKVERLHDISDEDCLKEGIYKEENVRVIGYHSCLPFAYTFYGAVDNHKEQLHWSSAKGAFTNLIDRVSDYDIWGYNPWVFAYSFELVK